MIIESNSTETTVKKFTKNVQRILSTKIITISAGLLTSILIARVLGPAKNGEIAAILVYPSLFMSLGTLGIRQSTTYLVGKKTFPLVDIKSSIAKIWSYSSVISILFSSLLLVYFNKVTQDPIIIALAVIPIPFYLFNSYNAGIFLGKNNIGLFNKINWIPPVIILLISFLFIFLFDCGIEGYLFAILIANLCTFLILFIKYRFWTSFMLTTKRIVSKKLINLGLMYAISLFIITLNYKFDIILLNQLSTAENTGIYAKGAGIAQYLWQVPMLFSTIIFAGSANSKNNLKYSFKVFRLLRVTFIFSLFIAFIIFLFSEHLVVFLFGSAFLNSSTSIDILLPGVVLLMFFKVLNMDLAGKGKPLVSLKAMLPALVLNIILNYSFIPEYGSNGAALASTISYSIGGVLFLYFYSKSIRVSLKKIIWPQRGDFLLVKEYLFNK